LRSNYGHIINSLMWSHAYENLPKITLTGKVKREKQTCRRRIKRLTKRHGKRKKNRITDLLMQSCLAVSRTLAPIFLKSESTIGKTSAAPANTKKGILN